MINAGDDATAALRELVRLMGAPCTSTLMGLGAYPSSDPQFLGMLGMHGTVEANMAMHGCDVMLNIGARFDDRVTGRLNAFAPDALKIHCDIDPSSINKNVVVDIPVVGDAGLILRAMIAAWHADTTRQDKSALAHGGGRSTAGAPRNACATPRTCARRHHQAAARHPPAARRLRRARHLHQHRGRPAPDVGRAAFRLRPAEPLDDLRRAGHHGLRPARGDGRADRPPGRAVHRHRRRGLAS